MGSATVVRETAKRNVWLRAVLLAAGLLGAIPAVAIAQTATQPATQPAAEPARAAAPSGYGPGMMGRPGMGPGMMNGGNGMGGGMMGMMGAGGGMGPAMMGMMGGGCGMGPGMMAMMGGACRMGPGMMGMMGGYGRRGMGLLGLPGLTDQQRAQIVQIQNDLRKKNWPLLGKLLDEHAKLQELCLTSEPKPAAVGAQYQKMAELRRQMIENAVAAHNQLDKVLTKEQREQLRRYAPWE